MGGLVDIAKNGNKGSGPVLMDRTQALTQLWTHAVARNGARKDEVVTAGALDAAATVCSPKFAADPPAQGAAAGLLETPLASGVGPREGTLLMTKKL